jgi:trimeric autotransporter adhesin
MEEIMRRISMLVLILCACFVSVAWGQQPASTDAVVPPLVNFSGVLTDTNNKALTGVVGVTFALYKDEQGGAPLWVEGQNVRPDKNGHYSVMLGSASKNGLPSEIFASGEARWLGVQPQGQAERPRTLLLSVPYALKAVDAQTIGGLAASAFVRAAPPATPGEPSSPGSGTSSSGSQPNVSGSGTANYVPVWTDNNGTLGNSVLFQKGTGSTAKIGINTTTPSSTLDVKGGSTVRGLFSLPATGTATASKGFNSQALKQTASAFNSGSGTAVAQNFQWQAEPVGNNTANPTGSLNLLFAQGTSKLAETGLNIASNGQITFAKGQTFPGMGTVTSVGSGLGLTGGPITTIGTLTIDTTVVPQLNVANTFTGNQAVNGNLSATGTVTGSSFGIGSNLFAFGSYSLGNAFLGFAGNATMTGNYNTASGYQVLAANTTGYGNTASGAVALSSNTTGTDNTASGTYGLSANTTGNSNTASGVSALVSNTAGSDNTASGFDTLFRNTTGSNNTASGEAALYYNTTGNYNTALGYLAGPDRNHPGLINATAIGANAVVSQSNSLVLGGTGPNAVKVGIGTATPTAMLDVRGTGNFTDKITFAPGQTFPGTGTITGVTAGTDLTGGGTGGNVTLNVDTTKVVTGVMAGTDLTGGGTGGVQTLNLDTTKVPQLNSTNTFTGNQAVNGNLSATGTVTGSSFGIGSNLFAFGSYANRNAFLGFAGNTTTTGSYNTASGYQSLFSNTTGYQNTATGYVALSRNTTGHDNTASGNVALFSNTAGYDNTAIGSNALNRNTTANDNTATGTYALVSNTTGSYNTASGSNALNHNTTGHDNTASGYLTLLLNTTGNYNTASGSNALNNNTAGTNNTASGYRALYNNTTANENTASGYVALSSNTTGEFNVASGAYALLKNTTGYQNTAIGYLALLENTIGSGNTAIGGGALYSNTTGLYNTAIGDSALGDSTTDSYLTCVGKNCAAAAGVNHATAIGAHAYMTQSNTLVLGSIQNTNGCSPSIGCTNTKVGIGTTTPSNVFTIGSSFGPAIADGWTTYSSRRWKTNIHPLANALGKIEQLRGVSYDLKQSGKHEIGVIAEEVGKVVPEIVSWDKNGKDAQGVDYGRLTALLIEATKEQQQEIQSQQAVLRKQAAAIRSLKSELWATRQTLERVKAQVATAKPTWVATK